MLFGEDVKTFGANRSMKIVLNQMIQYVNKMRQKKVEECKGCIAHNICTDCIFSQQKTLNINEYMNEKCKVTYKRLFELKIIEE